MAMQCLALQNSTVKNRGNDVEDLLQGLYYGLHIFQMPVKAFWL